MTLCANDPLTPERLEALLVEIEPLLPQATFYNIKRWLTWLVQLAIKLEEKDLTIAKFKRWIFGKKTEKSASAITPEGTQNKSRKPTQKPGHGRHGAKDFPTATRCSIHPTDVHAGQACPACLTGTLYRSPPTRRLRFEGQAPIVATCYELEKLRCGDCGEIYTASWPQGLGSEKYASSAVAMLALLKYGHGMPWYRLAQLQAQMQIPLAPSTQWQLLNTQSPAPNVIYQALIGYAAQAPLLHNDDTTMRILTLQREPADTRTGIFTTGIVACAEDYHIALYFTGTQHAGEDLAQILAQRQADLDPPRQMCDALDRNLPAGFATILGNCLTHGRRKFVEITDYFPEECHVVILMLRDIYRHDDQCKTKHFSPLERLAYHQTHSKPKMDELEKWMKTQIDEHRVEPNSALGKAIAYMRNHWHPLTLFLREPGAPLDNNCVERILKRVILHRKNALFYKTKAGAMIGDIYMSIIHTCQLNRVNPFAYLTAILENATQVIAQPNAWLPWIYADALPSAP